VRSFLTIALAGAAVFAVTAAPAFSRDKDSDRLVWHGKVHLPASKVPARETVLEPSAKVIPSSGRFVREGKTQVWIPNERATETSEPSASSGSRDTTTSKGRFVQRGKAQVWVPNDK
jgi:hypothetical protein